MSSNLKRSPRNIALNRLLLSIATATALTASIGAVSASDAPTITPTLRSAMQRDLGLSPGQLPQLFEAEQRAERQDAQARRDLGANYAGGWLERAADGSTVFVVATTGNVRAVQITGADVRQVRYSLAQLDAAANKLDALITRPVMAKLPQIQSWRVDPQTNSVVVTVDPDALDTGIDFVAASGAASGMVRFETSRNRPQTAVDVRGGDLYTMSNGFSCSVGFSATRGATRFMVTAGHCGTVGVNVFGFNGASMGVVDGSTFPSRDWAVVRITNGAVWGSTALVNNYAGGNVIVRGSTVAGIGASICRSGARTGYRCGTISATNVTVNYGGQVVTGLTQSNACGGQGDSGGSWITPAGQAQGVYSGGSFPASGENCSIGAPVNYFQPLNPILSNYGLTLVRQ